MLVMSHLKCLFKYENGIQISIPRKIKILWVKEVRMTEDS
jgi:hypothetical protein